MTRNTLSRSQSYLLLQVVIEAMPNAVVLVGKDGEIQLVNSRAARMFGYTAAQLVGEPVSKLMPARYRTGHAADHARFMQQPGTREMGAGRDLFGLRQDGTELPIEVGLDVLRIPEQTFVLASIFDASKRRDAQISADNATALAQSIIDCAPFSIVATDIDGRIIEVSPAAEKLFGLNKSDLIGKPAASYLHDSPDPAQRRISLSKADDGSLPATCSELSAAVKNRYIDAREWTLFNAAGQQVQIHMAVSGLRHKNGSLIGYIAIAQDISDQKRDAEQIRFIAEHDALTGLPNRALLNDRLNLAIAHAKRSGKRLGVLQIDLDHFKRVNDSLGHHAGDQLLIGVARRLADGVRASDTVARLGGDEFVVLLVDLNSAEEAARIAAKLVEQIAPPLSIDGQSLEVSASIGVCAFPDDGQDADALLKNADTAMYAAKAAGRGRYSEFTASMAEEAADCWFIEGALRRALIASDLRMHYQVQTSLLTREVFGAEALMRWSLDGVDMQPGRFIPIAEQAGLIGPLGEWALRTACIEIGALLPSLPAGFRLSVNVSPRQLRLAELPRLVGECLAAGKLPASALELEVTESALLLEDARSIIAQLRAMGVQVAIDDFGTGFSSLSHITRFPVDCLKIDRSFVQNIEQDDSQAAVTAAIIAIGKRLGIAVIAEGIESGGQLRALIDQGCTRGQGFLFSQARPAADLLGVIHGLSTHSARATPSVM